MDVMGRMSSITKCWRSGTLKDIITSVTDVIVKIVFGVIDT
jgi:hypothetical protein